MANLLVVYGTTEGQTAKIAQHIADVAGRHGHDVTVQAAADAAGLNVDDQAAVIIGASLHEGRYQRSVRRFIKHHRDGLAARPGAFFSVSLAAVSDDPREHEDVQRRIEEFCRDAGWQPTRTESFAGALKYTEYSWLKRALMKQIAAKEGGPTDTSRDFEYTDWDRVTAFTESFLAGLPADANA